MDRTGPGQHDHVEIRAFSCPPHNNGSPQLRRSSIRELFSTNCAATSSAGRDTA